ncbi:HDOD domain-containing protein [uncultured Azonexus sp.]|uniref:HDOD domain-containing protein n=1 Tax=uncultured Azonexus sp. TaxID=520307 RepID=UPI00263748E1|nr:HDOD domain-containing protein [uncultured Azonexus sp.]
MKSVPEEQQLQSMLSGVDIPPCPSILVELDRELKKDEPDHRELVRLMSSDVALSGHVMQIANSPAFSTGHKLSSINQAINVLGTRQVFNLVVSQLLKVALAGKDSASLERFWESSALTARLSGEIARRLRCIRPDVAYTFGLFHDCGIPLLMRRFPETRSVLGEANDAEDMMFTEVEDKYLGTNHAVVGYFLARRWRLPDEVAEAILRHHDYSVLQRRSEFSSVVLAQIAINVLAEHIIRLQAGGVDHEWAKAAPLVCDFFGLSLGGVDDLIEDLRDWLG